MKIALDARWIFAEISGVGLYTRELIKSLVSIDNENKYILLFNDEKIMERVQAETGFSRAENFSSVFLSHAVLSLKNQFLLTGFLSKEEIDLYHSPNWIIPFFAFPRGKIGRTACVTTVHDVIPLLFPDHAPKAKKTKFYPIYRGLMREVGKRSDLILTVSSRSRSDIIKCLNIPEVEHDKVKTIYNGVGEQFSPSSEKDEKKEKVILYVGRADPY
ncbi:MAG TPA: glycosyltransferase, partial [Synergistaceae bacterium]|nr:glycosyltransferase [Synergistaceae bacterium]